MEENFNQNQTHFSADEPILEQPLPVVTEEQVLTQKKPFPKYLYFVIGMVVFVVAVLVFAVLNKPKNQGEEVAGVTPTPKPTKELTPIEQKLQVAKTKLELSNPTTEKYPFPPLNMELRIDEAR